MVNMLTLLGNALILLALLVTLHQILRPEAGADPLARLVTLSSQVSPFILLVMAFLVQATTLELVSDYVGDELPLFYRISAVWGSRAGPLLMWAAIVSVITLAMDMGKSRVSTSARIMHSWNAILLSLSLIMEPFASSDGGPRGELNPLLQTDLMVIHPPVVFLFYSLCLAVASIALSGFIRMEPPEQTHKMLLKWARYAFLAGTIGIGLGGLWAYSVLDWGGYWAWDPVETGSLLPWLGLLAILHARPRRDSDSKLGSSPAIAMIVGALVMHATLVTRANGVWASVHAFVGDGSNSMPSDPYARVLQIADTSAVGIEVTTYLLMVVSLGCFALAHLVREQILDLEEKGSSTLFRANRGLSFSLLGFFAAVGLWIGSTAVAAVGLAILFLLVNADSERPPGRLVAAGVLLMLFSSWGWVAEWYQAMAGIAPFLLVWLIPDDEEGEASILKMFTEPSVRTRIAVSIPFHASLAFLLLTWLLLTVEIDGTNLDAHELYGAPMLAILALALSWYSVGSLAGASKVNAVVAAVLILSLSLPFLSGSIHLPGDPDLPITPSLSRGDLSIFILSWLALALPATAWKLWKTIRKSSSGSRILGSHLAHFGIILLLVGHVMTTTLVDRSDPSHLVNLEKGEPVEYGGMELVFLDVEIASSEDEGYAYGIGDGFVGVLIEVRVAGESVGTLEPGMLRFDSPSGSVTARSEVDRLTRITGDTIVILDVAQSNELLSAMILGQTEQVEQIRVTVHHLPGSHLVWVGWMLVVIGSGLSSVSSPIISHEQEE
ncbi:MAG TPA: cytochrome c biogenesis protein CcsA [Candidatus Thalassarchaeaceae archaeon]|jgi:cytochrome c-type biogenesis protein CcmF|nr:cytochrome c biogenesis protein CcsA [Candidatus Thalassarchaeaceae archaeon]|tara:strand:+ start:10762 stop:13098 length:2337 start_codon:yes stop_codon:yes gene_type:complete